MMVLWRDIVVSARLCRQCPERCCQPVRACFSSVRRCASRRVDSARADPAASNNIADCDFHDLISAQLAVEGEVEHNPPSDYGVEIPVTRMPEPSPMKSHGAGIGINANAKLPSARPQTNVVRPPLANRRH
jgi:hypothetical protein